MARLFVLFALLGLVSVALGEPHEIHRKIPAVKAAEVPLIDGDPTDKAWESAPVADKFWDRNAGGQAAEQTVAKLLYDGKHLYVAFWCFDSKPDELTARETQEDSRFTGENSLSEDCVDIRIDPFGTGSQSELNIFSVTPIGTKSAYMGVGRGRKTEWKGAWEAAVKRTEQGWTAEMRIPWSILNYPGNAPRFHVNFARFQFRTKCHMFWCNVGPNLRNDYAGFWEGVQPPAPPKPKISFLPYVLPGVENGKFTFRSGIDARYPVTSDLTAVATLNPDFGTIEGAVDSVAFSRAERFLPERRPFFLEGASIFEMGNPWQIGRFFYPRRIDRFDLGTKLYGKITPKDTIGLLHTVTFQDRMDFVGSWQHQPSPNRSIKGLVINKTTQADDNSVGVANYFERTGKINTMLRGAVSGGNDRRGHAYSTALGYEDKHAYSLVQYHRVTDDFRAADGLIDFRGYRGWYLYQNLNNRYKTGPLEMWNVEMEGFYDWRSNGNPFRRGFNIFGFMITRNDWAVDAYKTHLSYDGVLDNVQGFGVTRGFNNRFLRVGMGADSGIIAGEKFTFWGPRANVRLFKKLDLGYSSAFQNFVGHSKQSILTMTYELSPTRSIGGRLVETNGDTNWYLSYRDSGRAGIETYFIVGDPNAPKFRSIAQLKIVIPFTG